MNTKDSKILVVDDETKLRNLLVREQKRILKSMSTAIKMKKRNLPWSVHFQGIHSKTNEGASFWIQLKPLQH